MPAIYQNPLYGGGYTTPRHVFIPPTNVHDLGDGHVAHPTGDPRFGLGQQGAAPQITQIIPVTIHNSNG